MKMTVVMNYWLMIISWCLFLDGHSILSEVIAFGCCWMLIRYRKINIIKAAIRSIVIYLVMSVILNSSTIPYFFPNLSIHLLLVSINCSVVYEYLKRLNSHFILPIILVMILSIAFITTLIIIIPGEYYTIFGKVNLLLLEIFIFLPYLITILVCFVSDTQIRKGDRYVKTKGLQL